MKVDDTIVFVKSSKIILIKNLSAKPWSKMKRFLKQFLYLAVFTLGLGIWTDLSLYLVLVQNLKSLLKYNS